MKLIKPRLWQGGPDKRYDGAVQNGTGRDSTHPSRRGSPLAARTAALLQRLRAEAPEHARSVVTSRAPDKPFATAVDDADLNRICLTGVLGSEPLLYDVGDHPAARLALASERRWRDLSGVIQLETTWFDLTAWEALAEQCGRLLHRGDRVYVEGTLHLWTEVQAPQSYACHTVIIDRMVLLAAGTNGRTG
jgi:hypothetical protein